MDKNKQLAGLITGLVALIAVIVFFLLGFLRDAWSIAWIVFLAVPLTAVITDVIFGKKNRLDVLIGAVALLCVAVFLILGFTADLWGIAWIVFLLIPITSIIVNMVKTVRNDKAKREQTDEEQQRAERPDSHDDRKRPHARDRGLGR